MKNAITKTITAEMVYTNEDRALFDQEFSQELILGEEFEFELSDLKDEETLARKQFYDNLFTKKETEIINSANERIREYQLMSTNTEFQQYIHYLANKYSDKLSYNEVMSEVMFQSWRVIKSHTLLEEDNNWTKMLNRTEENRRDLNRLFSHIKKVIDVTMWKMALDIRQITKNGNTEYIEEVFASLDITLDDVVDARLLVDEITGSFWSADEEFGEAYKSKFTEWFETHKEKYLTKRQLDFLDSFKDGVGNIEGNTSLATQQDVQMDGASITRMIDRIRERMEKAQEEFMFEYNTEKLVELENLNDEYEIKDWLRENINEFKDLLYHQPFYKDLKKELRAKKGSTDNTFLADMVLMEHLEELRKLIIPKGFYKTEEEKKRYDSEQRIKEYNEFTKNSDVTVYKDNKVDHIVKESPSKEFQALNMAQMLYLS